LSHAYSIITRPQFIKVEPILARSTWDPRKAKLETSKKSYKKMNTLDLKKQIEEDKRHHPKKMEATLEKYLSTSEMKKNMELFELQRQEKGYADMWKEAEDRDLKEDLKELPKQHSLNAYPPHALNSFYSAHLETLGRSIPLTIQNLSLNRKIALEFLTNSEEITSFRKQKREPPLYEAPLREYKEWAKRMMSGRNKHKPILTEQLSAEKMRRGQLNELTRKKGIDVMIRTCKLRTKGRQMGAQERTFGQQQEHHDDQTNFGQCG
jgi:hypothetical protein